MVYCILFTFHVSPAAAATLSPRVFFSFFLSNLQIHTLKTIHEMSIGKRKVKSRAKIEKLLSRKAIQKALLTGFFIFFFSQITFKVCACCKLLPWQQISYATVP